MRTLAYKKNDWLIDWLIAYEHFARTRLTDWCAHYFCCHMRPVLRACCELFDCAFVAIMRMCAFSNVQIMSHEAKLAFFPIVINNNVDCFNLIQTQAWVHELGVYRGYTYKWTKFVKTEQTFSITILFYRKQDAT